MAIDIVSFPIKNGGSFHSYVTVYQRVFETTNQLEPVGTSWNQLEPLGPRLSVIRVPGHSNRICEAAPQATRIACDVSSSDVIGKNGGSGWFL